MKTRVETSILKQGNDKTKPFEMSANFHTDVLKSEYIKTRVETLILDNRSKQFPVGKRILSCGLPFVGVTLVTFILSRV